MSGVACACRLIQVCLTYSQRHPSTAADDLALAAINLLGLAIAAGTSTEVPDVSLIQSMLQPGSGNETWQGFSILAQLKASGICLVLPHHLVIDFPPVIPALWTLLLLATCPGCSC